MTVLSKIKKRLIANGLLVVITLLSYGAVYVSPQTYWLAGFMALLIPLWLVLNGLFVFYWLTRRSMYLLLSLSMLMLGATFLQSTLAFDLGTSTKDSTHFSVLSYNVRVFNVYDHLQDEDSASSKEMINWVIEHKAEIKCLQEMYNEDSSRLFNTVERIARSGDYNYYLTPVPNNNQYKGGFFGLAIFSKFPILNSGELPLSENRGNRCLFVDVLIRKDTLRIYNVHLQSMSIDEKSLLENESVAASPYQDLIKRLKRGFEARAKQIEIVEEHLRACPYPVIISGDFNETPYGYVYHYLKGSLHNAFEKAGNGLGFSYNGRLFFLRIDHQFFDQRLVISSFKTHRNISYSDHFPIVGTYAFRE